MYFYSLDWFFKSKKSILCILTISLWWPLGQICLNNYLINYLTLVYVWRTTWMNSIRLTGQWSCEVGSSYVPFFALRFIISYRLDNLWFLYIAWNLNQFMWNLKVSVWNSSFREWFLSEIRSKGEPYFCVF